MEVQADIIMMVDKADIIMMVHEEALLVSTCQNIAENLVVAWRTS